MIDAIDCFLGKHEVVTVASTCDDHYHLTKLCAHCGKVISHSEPMSLKQIVMETLEGKPLQ